MESLSTNVKTGQVSPRRGGQALRLPWWGEALGVAGVLFLTGVRALIETDIVGDDESAYLSRGLAIRSGVMPAFTDGAGYSALYWLASFLFPDPIDLYFVGRVGVAIIFVAGIWGAARFLTHPGVALLPALLAAMMPATYVWPGVSGPAVGLVLVALAVAIRFPGALSLCVASGLLWLAGSIRPEFVYGAIVSSFLAGAFFIRFLLTRPRPTSLLRNGVAVSIGVVGIPVGLISLFGSPISDAGRSWVAFGQHFARRNTVEGEYHWTDWGQVVERSFPGASSVMEAFVVNPLALFQHIIYNAAWAPLALGRSLVGYPGIDGPTVFFSWFAVGLVALLLAIGLWRNTTVLRQIPAVAKKAIMARLLQPGWWLVVVVFALSLASVLVVYPRTHYMILWAGALLVGVGILFHRLPPTVSLWTIAAPSLAAIFVAFGGYSGWLLVQEPAVQERPAASALADIRLLDRDMAVLGRTREMQVYTESLWQVVAETPEVNEGLREFFDRTQTDIVFAEEPGVSTPWTMLPEWEEFQSHPKYFGFSGSKEAGFFYR